MAIDVKGLDQETYYIPFKHLNGTKGHTSFQSV